MLPHIQHRLFYLPKYYEYSIFERLAEKYMHFLVFLFYIYSTSINLSTDPSSLSQLTNTPCLHRDVFIFIYLFSAKLP
jgi:hypothetical protein